MSARNISLYFADKDRQAVLLYVVNLDTHVIVMFFSSHFYISRIQYMLNNCGEWLWAFLFALSMRKQSYLWRDDDDILWKQGVNGYCQQFHQYQQPYLTEHKQGATVYDIEIFFRSENMSTSTNFSKLLSFVNNKTSQNTQFAILPVKMNELLQDLLHLDINKINWNW